MRRHAEQAAHKSGDDPQQHEGDSQANGKGQGKRKRTLARHRLRATDKADDERNGRYIARSQAGENAAQEDEQEAQGRGGLKRGQVEGHGQLSPPSAINVWRNWSAAMTPMCT